MEISDLIGVPFVSRGRDPKIGLDCWGLVMEIGRRMGKNIPDFYRKNGRGWIKFWGL